MEKSLAFTAYKKLKTGVSLNHILQRESTYVGEETSISEELQKTISVIRNKTL